MTMRGASAESFAALGEQLTEAAGTGDPAKLGEDLFGVSALLRHEPGLRRVLTDVSTDAKAKSGLVRSIFEGKVDDAALDLVADAAARRWASSRDLGDSLEQLGVEAVVRSSDTDQGETERLSDELFALAQLVDHSPELRSALSDPARSVQDKQALLRALLEDKAHPATIRLAEQALSGSHRSFRVAIGEYQKVAASVHGESVATVHVAAELGDTERQRLQDALGKQYGRQVHLNVVVEPKVIGGMRVEIGDDVIDGTVSGRLAEARRLLAG